MIVTQPPGLLCLFVCLYALMHAYECPLMQAASDTAAPQQSSYERWLLTPGYIGPFHSTGCCSLSHLQCHHHVPAKVMYAAFWQPHILAKQ